MKQHVTADTDVPECIEVVKEIYLENYPLFTRRWNFFSEKQPIGESFSRWYAKLQAKAQDADIYKMTAEEMVMVQLIAMTTDTELQKELLKLKNPTRQEVVAAARAFEAAKQSSENNAIPRSWIVRKQFKSEEERVG